MRNIALRLRYDGSRYHGWQVQKNAVTVAQTLEEALAKVCKEDIRVTGCGRTDAGVHALRYCANFRTDSSIPVDRIPLAVNARLPEDIAVTGAVEAEEEFNAILSCRKKEYIYKILNSRIPDPFLSQRVCFWPQNLDIAMIAEAAEAFVGTHDFRAVRSLGTETRTTRFLSVQMGFCTFFAGLWWGRWFMQPMVNSSLRRSRNFWKRGTGA